ncbi:MAG: transposase [Armatimonadota bacterium]
MSDNLRRYFAIQKALKSLRQTEPKGNVARHLNTLAMLIAGIVGSQKCHLPAIARKVPADSKPQSRIRKMERFLANKAIDSTTYYLPYVQTLLDSLPPGPLVLVIDGSEAGRDCVSLAINVVYKKRALPLCWLVVTGKKGHLSEQTHIELVQKVAPLLPAERSVVFLGDGEFDGVELLATLQSLGWDYVCRTAKNVLLTEAGERFQPTDLLLQPGDRIELPDVGFTAEEYGPVLVAIVWEIGWKDPLVLVSNLDFLAEAHAWYQRRFRIETFFSDQKSRGFYLGHSHISDIAHLNRLLIATCLAYLWLVCLGQWVLQTGKLPLIHRSDRCDWSLFRIGLYWIDYCLNEEIPIWTQFAVPEWSSLKSVG